MIADILGHGGFVLAAILLASVVGLTVVIERTLRLVRLPRQHALEQRRLLAAPQRELITSEGAKSAVERVLSAGWAARERGIDAVRLHALDAAQREVVGFERGLGTLATVAQITPLLGLLGTVAGLMEAFAAAQAADQVTTDLLAGGIFKALGTTAAGLAVSIPAWVAYNALSGLVGRLGVDLEHAAAELVDRIADTEGAA